MIGFVYIWFDRHRRMFYLGSHVGCEDDGYVCGSYWMLAAIKKRPNDFRRRVIQRVAGTRADVYRAEDRWLQLIKPVELGSRYYNLKRHAYGGWSPGSASKAGKRSAELYTPELHRAGKVLGGINGMRSLRDQRSEDERTEWYRRGGRAHAGKTRTPEHREQLRLNLIKARAAQQTKRMENV